MAARKRRVLRFGVGETGRSRAGGRLARGGSEVGELAGCGGLPTPGNKRRGRPPWSPRLFGGRRAGPDAE